MGLRFRLQIHTAFEHCLSFETLDEKESFIENKQLKRHVYVFQNATRDSKLKYYKGNNDVSHHLNGVNLAQ